MCVTKQYYFLEKQILYSEFPIVEKFIRVYKRYLNKNQKDIMDKIHQKKGKTIRVHYI